jgi:hypothetical protein
LGGILPVVAVVHRDGEGTAGLDEMPTDIRDSCKFTNEGHIGWCADLDNVFDMGEGDNPYVVEDNRKNDFQPVTSAR